MSNERSGRKPSRSEIAAAARQEQERADRRRQYLRVGITGLVLVAVVVVGVVVYGGRDTTGDVAGKTPFPTTSATLGDTQVASADTYGLAVGDPDAPVKVEVFEDFLCPFCQQYEAAGREQLRKDAADGKAYVVYRPLAFLNEYSERSLNAFAVVMQESGPAVALRFHDLLYENQPSETGDMPDDDWIIAKAVEAGADESAIRSGIEGDDFSQWVSDATDAGSKRGVTGTPTVYVNGEATSATSIDDLVTTTQQAIDDGQ